MDIETRERRMRGLISATDMMTPERPRGLVLRTGYALYRGNGASLGLTMPGDRISKWDWVAGGPAGVVLPMPTSAIPEWIQGEISDADGPCYSHALVIAAAVDPHAE